MQFILYKTADDDNVINKLTTDPLIFDLFLRSDTDIVNPSIPLTRIPGIEFSDYNYAFIPDLFRFYFVRDWSIVNLSIVRLGLELDYLETYKEKILAAHGTFSRPIKPGDYGDVTADVTGRTIESRYSSSVTLQPGGEGILSLIKPE